MHGNHRVGESAACVETRGGLGMRRSEHARARALQRGRELVWWWERSDVETNGRETKKEV